MQESLEGLVGKACSDLVDLGWGGEAAFLTSRLVMPMWPVHGPQDLCTAGSSEERLLIDLVSSAPSPHV